MNQGSKYRLFFYSMIFAFLWVIIGDLVNMHIHLITGNDLYGHHQPFSKTHKTDKKSLNVKNKKASDNTKAPYLDFITVSSLNFSNFEVVKTLLYWVIPKFMAKDGCQLSLGRAPPYA